MLLIIFTLHYWLKKKKKMIKIKLGRVILTDTAVKVTFSLYVQGFTYILSKEEVKYFPRANIGFD